MIEHKLAPIAATDSVVETPQAPPLIAEPAAPEARCDLDRHRADTERLRVLVEFLGRPIHAHGGFDPDPDIITAYNLAVEAALREIRRAACSQ